MKVLHGIKKGINLGGWLSQCSHNKEHYESFISEEDLKKISSWGLDHVRLPIDYEVIETQDGQYKEEGFGYIDSCLAWCKKYKLKMIIDIHKTAGYSFNDAYGDENNLFANLELQQRFLRLWDQISTRYAKDQDAVVFELLNEIVESENSEPWNKLAYKTIECIRKNCPVTPIIVGGIQWNSVRGVALLDMPYDENVIYTFHFYEPFAFTHQKAHWVPEMPKDLNIEYPSTLIEYKKAAGVIGEKAEYIFGNGINDTGLPLLEKLLMEAIEVAKHRNVALYCGEYGVIDQAPVASTINWFEDMHALFEKYGIGRAVWTYKDMDFGITDKHYEPIKDDIVALL